MNYYEILKIQNNASKNEINTAFRNQAKAYHPDLNKGEDAKQKIIEVFEAYQVLKDDNKRMIYDRQFIRKSKIEPDNVFNDWIKNVKEEAEKYSEKDFKVFSEEVLEKIKNVTVFTTKILYYFGLLLLCGLASMVLSLILRSFLY